VLLLATVPTGASPTLPSRLESLPKTFLPFGQSFADFQGLVLVSLGLDRDGGSTIDRLWISSIQCPSEIIAIDLAQFTSSFWLLLEHETARGNTPVLCVNLSRALPSSAKRKKGRVSEPAKKRPKKPKRDDILRVFELRGESLSEWKRRVADMHPPAEGVTSERLEYWWRAYKDKTADDVVMARRGRTSIFTAQELNDVYEAIIVAQWEGQCLTKLDIVTALTGMMRANPMRFKGKDKLSDGWWKYFLRQFPDVRIADTVRIEDERFKQVTSDRIGKFERNLADLMRRDNRKWFCFMGYDETGFHGSDLYGRISRRKTLGVTWLPSVQRSGVGVRDHWTALCGAISVPAPPMPVALISTATSPEIRERVDEACAVHGLSKEATARMQIYTSESGNSNSTKQCSLQPDSPRQPRSSKTSARRRCWSTSVSFAGRRASGSCCYLMDI
jgi:hypothetical protein